MKPNIRSICSLRYGMTQSPHQRVSCNIEWVCRSAFNQVVPVSALDIVTDPESVELLIPDEILNPSPLSDPSPPLSNDSDPPIGLPELEAEVNALPLSIPSRTEKNHVRRVRTMPLPRIS